MTGASAPMKPLTIIRQMWTENQIEHRGRFYDLTDISMEPKSQAPDGIPIWVGGSSDAALRRAARFGDGWTSNPDELGPVAAEHGEGTRVCRRDGPGHEQLPGHPQLGHPHRQGPGEGPERCSRAILGDGGRVPFDELVEDYVCAGDADDCARVIRKFINAGASWFMLSPMGKLEDLMPQLELIAQDLIPKFR